MEKRRRSRRLVSVIGGNEALAPRNSDIYRFADLLGEELARLDCSIICGGLGGVMEGVCEGVVRANNPLACTIGLLPGLEKSMANPYCQYVLPTGVGYARNVQVVLAGDFVVALGGGGGTLSEIAHAWQLGKSVLALEGFGGWSSELGGRDLDSRRSRLIKKVSTLDEIIAFTLCYYEDSNVS